MNKMNKIPLIIFFVALAITIPSMIIFYSPVNGEEIEIQIGGKYSEHSVDPEPTECSMGMSSVDKILCKKLDKIIENQEVIFENQERIFDLISFWQEYISGMKK